MELVCILCPKGCNIEIEENIDQDFSVSGFGCKRGKKYAIEELTCPQRLVTSSVFVQGGNYCTVSVKTKNPVDRSRIPDVLKELVNFIVKAPVSIGDVLITNVAGTGVDIIATREVSEKNPNQTYKSDSAS